MSNKRNERMINKGQVTKMVLEEDGGKEKGEI